MADIIPWAAAIGCLCVYPLLGFAAGYFYATRGIHLNVDPAHKGRRREKDDRTRRVEPVTAIKPGED